MKNGSNGVDQPDQPVKPKIDPSLPAWKQKLQAEKGMRKVQDLKKKEKYFLCYMLSFYFLVLSIFHDF